MPPKEACVGSDADRTPDRPGVPPSASDLSHAAPRGGGGAQRTATRGGPAPPGAARTAGRPTGHPDRRLAPEDARDPGCHPLCPPGRHPPIARPCRHRTPSPRQREAEGTDGPLSRTGLSRTRPLACGSATCTPQHHAASWAAPLASPGTSSRNTTRWGQAPAGAAASADGRAALRCGRGNRPVRWRRERDAERPLWGRRVRQPGVMCAWIAGRRS